jgi:exopolyphosphatase/guanosine-5'-triphosphate,3'-diphosphate pyrophosphatase
MRDSAFKAGHIDRWRPPGVDPARLAVFPGGLVLLSAAFEALGIGRMQAAEGALREGLLYDLIGRIGEEDVRSRSVNALADRFHVDWKQAESVEQTALNLVAQVAGDWKLTSKESTQFLSWAAKLHEVGLDIAHHHYHKHGAYIVAESDLFGFSREEQGLLATLVRAHRRKFPASAIGDLPRHRIQEVERLAIILRLAVILHRSRSPDPIPEPKFAVEGKTLKLAFREGWLDDHPLKRADLHDEQAYLSSVGYRLEIT